MVKTGSQSDPIRISSLAPSSHPNGHSLLQKTKMVAAIMPNARLQMVVHKPISDITVGLDLVVI